VHSHGAVGSRPEWARGNLDDACDVVWVKVPRIAASAQGLNGRWKAVRRQSGSSEEAGARHGEAREGKARKGTEAVRPWDSRLALSHRRSPRTGPAGKAKAAKGS